MPVVETVGHRMQGLDSLRDAIGVGARGATNVRRVLLGERHDRALDAVQRAYVAVEPEVRHPRRRRLRCSVVSRASARPCK